MIQKFRGEYAFLSNFANTLIEYDGVIYTSVETAFQASKTLDINLRKRIARYEPATAKKVGRKITLRPDWDAVKDQIMYDLVKLKFSTDTFGHMSKLLETGDEYIEEGNTWKDTYWGVYQGEGLNKLGKTIMRVRDELKEEIHNA